MCAVATARRTGSDPADSMLREEPDEIADRAAAVGRERLDRTRADILITAVIGGVEVSLGALAAATVLGAMLTAVPSAGLFGGLAVGGIVFPTGFLFVILGRSELFTENFLIPVVTVVRRESTLRQLGELWAISWAGNIAGCAAMAALLSVPEAVGKPVTLGLTTYTDYKLGVSPVGTFASAILAGITMTILTWLVVATGHIAGKVVVIVAAGYLLFAANLAHAIVGSAIIFAGWHDTGRPLTDVVRWLALSTAGNLIGGVAFVTAFRVAQAREKERSKP